MCVASHHGLSDDYGIIRVSNARLATHMQFQRKHIPIIYAFWENLFIWKLNFRSLTNNTQTCGDNEPSPDEIATAFNKGNDNSVCFAALQNYASERRN